MTADERNDRIQFMLDLLHHPEWQGEESVRRWLEQEENRKLYEECRLYLEAGLRKETGHLPDVASEYEKFSRRYIHKIRIHPWKWTAAAAVLALMMAGGIWLTTKQDHIKKETVSLAGIAPAKIVPGKQQALLLTESGKTVRLGAGHSSAIEIEKGVIVKKDSTVGIHYSSAPNTDIHYHTLQVPKGGEFRVVLQDGTEVWLNSESELRYPTVFSGDRREIELKGEGYFSVTPDPERPFIVVTAGIRTKVYGTEFNVRSYDPQEVNITLVKGKVGVQREGAEREFALKPGENARFKENEPEISPVNVQKYTAWKEGYFYYEQEKVETILNDLKRWYDFDVIYLRDKVKELTFELWASRDSDISAIVELLVKTNKIDIKLEGRTLIVTKTKRKN